MTRLVWGEEKLYESGIEKAVLYLSSGLGVAWNGLVSVDDVLSNNENEIYYFDGEGYFIFGQISGYEAKIDAFTYPDEFLTYDGYDITNHADKQLRERFGLCYRTNRYIHLIYNCLASPTTKKYSTLYNIDPTLFSWVLETSPIDVAGSKPTAHIVIDLTHSSSDAVDVLEDKLYGTATTDPYLPLPSEIITIFETYALYLIQLNGDGTFTATGPDADIIAIDPTTYQLNWPDLAYTSLTSESYRLTSW